jgi:uncharacterized repeat protein (TIGR02543 family)
MKKGIFAILALLTVFAMVSCSNPTDPPPFPFPIGTSYNVTFDAAPGTFPGGGTTKVVSVGENQLVTEPDDADRPNYYVEGWYQNKNSSGVLSNPWHFTTDTVTQEITLYAKWTLVPAGDIVVTLEGNGGVLSNTTFVVAPSNPLSALNTITGVLAGYTLSGWNTAADGNGTAYTAASVAPGTNLTLYAQWTADGPPPDDGHFVEKVELINGNVAAYYFVLPNGKTFADYDGIKADYKVDEATFEAENRVRGGPRLYGNYPLSYLTFVEVEGTSLTQKFFAAAIGNGEGQWGNGNLILDNGILGGGWGTIDNQLAVGMASDPKQGTPVADDWWTLFYYTDASKANGDYNKLNGGFDGSVQAGLRNPSGAGPFIFGLGLTGNGTPTEALVRDVRLVGKTAGTVDLIGKPLYIKATADGQAYPAFVSYTSSSGNGVDNIRRTMVSGTEAIIDQVAAAAPPEYVVTFNLNKPTAATGTPVFATPAGFSGSVSIKEGFNLGVAPTATLTDYNFKGWVETAAGDAPIAGVDGKKVYAAKTLYALWALAADDIPPATADKDITDAVETSIFGNTTYVKPAGLGPFAFKVSDGYQGTIWFALTDDVNTAVYKEVQIKYTAVATDSTGKPRKLIFRNGRPDNNWSGGTEAYVDATVDTELTQTITINDLTKSNGIQIQHNKSDASCDFDLTITKITLIKP